MLAHRPPCAPHLSADRGHAHGESCDHDHAEGHDHKGHDHKGHDHKGHDRPRASAVAPAPAPSEGLHRHDHGPTEGAWSDKARLTLISGVALALGFGFAHLVPSLETPALLVAICR